MPLLTIRESWKEPLRPFYLKWLYFPLGGARPDYFDACWRFPTIQERPLAPAVPGRPDLLMLPMSDWHSRMQRTQHLATGLASLGHRCLYLSPHLGREFPGVYPGSGRLSCRRLHERIAELHIHLPREPVYHHRLLHEREESLIAGSLQTLLRQAGSERPAVLVSFPGWAGVARRLKAELGCPIIYDCHDLIEGFDNVPREFLAAEDALFGLSDLVLFTADWLRQEKLRQHASRIPVWAMLRNAVTPPDFASVKQPGPGSAVTIGYIGAISSWFDYEAMQAAASAHPEWRFLLVGRPESPQAAGLRRFPNVEFAGEVRYQDLPAWFSRMTAGTIPFRRLPLTMATNPVKLYEYLAGGLPVVSADLPEVARFGGLVATYQNPAEFVRRLEQAVAEGGGGRQARQDAVRGETWHARCLELQDALLRLQPYNE